MTGGEPQGGRFRVALVQTNSSDDMATNIKATSARIRAAGETGADFILTPETVALMEPRTAPLLEKTYFEDDDPALAEFRGLAAELGVWLLIGSIVVKIAEDKLVNRSYLVDAGGAISARYDKIHLFDVDLPDGESYRESKNYNHGGAAQIAETPWGKLGMTVCYDLRFAHLYRALAQAGASYLTVPSAFTRVTGQAHWHVLLRSRAIETGCYVIAPAQCGDHSQGRQTFGHSLVVDPWGEVLTDAGEEPGVVSADIDPARVAKARAAIPSLVHDREFSAP